jgi:hypothetical protein
MIERCYRRLRKGEDSLEGDWRVRTGELENSWREIGGWRGLERRVEDDWRGGVGR